MARIMHENITITRLDTVCSRKCSRLADFLSLHKCNSLSRQVKADLLQSRNKPLLSARSLPNTAQKRGPLQLSGFVCAFHLTVAGLNPKHTDKLFQLYYLCHSNEKRTKIKKKEAGFGPCLKTFSKKLTFVQPTKLAAVVETQTHSAKMLSVNFVCLAIFQFRWRCRWSPV